jgi:hypothetical protein
MVKSGHAQLLFHGHAQRHLIFAWACPTHVFVFMGMPRCTYFFGHAHAFHYFFDLGMPKLF